MILSEEDGDNRMSTKKDNDGGSDDNHNQRHNISLDAMGEGPDQNKCSVNDSFDDLKASPNRHSRIGNRAEHFIGESVVPEKKTSPQSAMDVSTEGSNFEVKTTTEDGSGCLIQ